jgi:8-oxo-dGTP diphosphatase
VFRNPPIIITIVNRQSSIVNRQSSIVNRQSSIVNRQSSIVNRQSSIVNRQSNMPSSEQGVNRERYMLIPRTAVFLRRANAYLLLKGAPTKRLWANQYNALGGHVADLWLCGTVVVETGQNPGICLYLFSGESLSGEPRPSPEGLAEWIDYDRLSGLPVVEDLPVLLGRLHAMKKGDPPFAARSFYDENAHLIVVFG